MSELERMRELEALLRRWAGGDGPTMKKMGICSNILGAHWEHLFDVEYPFDLFAHWPESVSYPEKESCPVEGEKLYRESRKNKWAGKYGEKRRRLCTWMADLLVLKMEGL